MRVNKSVTVIFGTLTAIVLIFVPFVMAANEYTNSAHGNSSTYGVLRPQMQTAVFARGNCAHCHEQHASVGGVDLPPTPPTGAQGYLLFDENHTNQATNICFRCHGTGTAYQDGGQVVNRSYSFRAGGWTTEILNNVEDAFSKLSSHSLTNIQNFAAGKSWKYTLNSNPCVVCHDPHLIQGDPANDGTYGNFPKSLTIGRGDVITTINTSPTTLFTLKMNPNITTTNYQAPYRYLGGPGNFEPEGNGTFNGSNLPDYVTFCTTCHDHLTTIFDTQNLTPVNWSAATGEIHGQFVYSQALTTMVGGGTPSPYNSGATSYVLSCLDCHEPHGSANLSLIRGEVNNGLVGPITSGVQYGLLCKQCHDPDPLGSGTPWDDVHHGGADPAYSKSSPCNNLGCHSSDTPPNPPIIDCSTCHYHGAAAGTWPVPDTTPVASGRKTF